MVLVYYGRRLPGFELYLMCWFGYWFSIHGNSIPLGTNVGLETYVIGYDRGMNESLVRFT